ncbi:hypothetical protein ABKV19_023305 [Rosa sericea]
MDAYMEVDAEDDGNAIEMGLSYEETQQTTINDVHNDMEYVVTEAIHDTDSEDQDGNTANRPRGKNKPNWGRRGSLEIMKFNNHGQAVEPELTVARWQRHLGQMVKDHTLFGLDVLDWREFRKSKVLDEAWSRIKRTIDWSDPDTRKKIRKIRYTTERKLNDRWKHYKATLRQVWYAPNWRTEERFHCGDKRVNNTQWAKLVNYWETPKGQRRTIANKGNRAKKRMNHTTGTRTFAQVRNQYKREHEGLEPNRCTLFELTHTRSNGEPVDKESEKAMMDMRQKISGIKDAKRANQLPETISNIEISEVYASVLGKEKYGVVRGFGLGVRLHDVPDVLVENGSAQLQVQALREEHEKELDCIRKESQEREDKLREDMNKQAMTTTDKMKQLEMQLQKQQAMFERLLTAGLSPNNIIPMCGPTNLSFPSGIGTYSSSLPTSSVEEIETPLVPIPPSTVQQNMQSLDDVYRPQLPTTVATML